MIELIYLGVGLAIGFMLGATAAAARSGDNVLASWRSMLHEMGDRLDEGQTVALSARISKYGDDGGDDEPSPLAYQDWSNN